MSDYEDGDNGGMVGGQQALERYKGLSLLDMLGRAQRALYATLLARIEDGTASREDIKVLRQLLAENGFTLAINEINQKMIDVTPNKVPIPDFSKQDFNE